MYKKISLLFLLFSSLVTKPLGVVELFSCIGFAVGAKVLYKNTPIILARLGYKKVLSMPIDLPTKVSGKKYSIELAKKNISAVVASINAHFIVLKKSIFDTVGQVSSSSSFTSFYQSEQNSSSKNSTQGASTCSFTQAQQNNFSARGFFPRIYITGPGLENEQNSRSKYRWQGAFWGSLVTAVSLKAVESNVAEKNKN